MAMGMSFEHLAKLKDLLNQTALKNGDFNHNHHSVIQTIQHNLGRP